MILIAMLFAFSAYGQQELSIKGVVINRGSREPIPYARVELEGEAKGAVTDSLGRFKIEQLSPSAYTLQVSYMGFETETTSLYLLSTKDLTVTIELEERAYEMEGVSVYPSPFRRSVESPVGMHTINMQEIENSPGGNRDISRIVQSYPGVSFSPAGYRNDLVVRGGGPSENSFYIDEVEIPNINHFSTQGASGGPVSIVNADLIREVDLYTAAFPAYSSNALSSVMSVKLREPSPDNHSVKTTLGASEASIAANGPISEKTTYLVSVRQSYLQLLFDMIGLPFLPTYNDAQFKIETKFSPKHELSILGIGALDNMKLNEEATTDDAEYILGYLPKLKQRTYTLGAVYKHYGNINSQTMVLSHSYMHNGNLKYRDNDESDPSKLMLDYNSNENETKFRFENRTNLNRLRIVAGLNSDYVRYDNRSFQRVFVEEGGDSFRYKTDLDFFKWGLFLNASYMSANDRFTTSFGVRADGASYSSKTRKMQKQISPRLSLSYKIADNLYLSSNIGRYYQLPPLTALGFKSDDGQYLNKGLKYMRVDQASLGINKTLWSNLELSLEGFYKRYDNMPLSVADGIPLTSKGDDYGVIGNELLTSTVKGRAYGVELLVRWLVLRKVNIASTLTLFKSQFKDVEDSYISSAWDNGYIFNLTGTYYLPRNWSVGAKLKSIGGTPYTPYDVDKSSLVEAWNASGKPYLDYSQYNSEKTSSYTQLDLRVDKIFYINKFMLGFYIDVENVTGSSFRRADVMVSTGEIANPDAPIGEQRYNMKKIKRVSSTTIPTFGITFEF